MAKRTWSVRTLARAPNFRAPITVAGIGGGGEAEAKKGLAGAPLVPAVTVGAELEVYPPISTVGAAGLRDAVVADEDGSHAAAVVCTKTRQHTARVPRTRRRNSDTVFPNYRSGSIMGGDELDERAIRPVTRGSMMSQYQSVADWPGLAGIEPKGAEPEAMSSV